MLNEDLSTPAQQNTQDSLETQRSPASSSSSSSSSIYGRSDSSSSSSTSTPITSPTVSSSTALTIPTAENDPWKQRYEQDWGVFPDVDMSPQDYYKIVCERYFSETRHRIPLIDNLSWLKSRCLQDYPQALPLSAEQQSKLIQLLLSLLRYERPLALRYDWELCRNDLVQLCQLLSHYVSLDSREALYQTLGSQAQGLNASAWSMLLGLPWDEAQFKQDLAAEVESQLPFGYHLGYWALITRHESGLSYFFTYACTQDKINQITGFGEHMLHLGARYGYIASLIALCRAGSDPNTPDGYAETPLHMAAMHGHVACVTALLNLGAKANTPSNKARETPLHLAARQRHVACVTALLSAGADPNAVNSRLQRPLHLAAEQGHVACATALLNAGATPNAVGDRRRTPLHLAAYNGHEACVTALLRSGADPNAVDGGHQTPLSLAAEQGHVACATALLNAGATPNAVGDRRRTPLHLAAHNGHEACVTALLSAGADPNATESLLRQTPLNWSAARGHIGCATALLREGVNPFGDNFLDETEATTLLASGVAVIDIPEIHRVLPIQLRTMIGLINDSQLVYTEVSLLGILLGSRTSQYPRIISTEKSREYSSLASFSPVGAPSGFMRFTLASCPPYIDLYGKNHLALALQGSNDSVAFLAAMPEQIRTVFINSLQHLASKKSAFKKSAFLSFILGENTPEQLEKLGRALNGTAPTQKFGRSTLFSHSAHNSPAASSSADTSSQNKNDGCLTM